MAHLKQFDVTCKVGLTMEFICYSILICSIFHLNWRVAYLIQFDVTCKVGLTMQLQKFGFINGVDNVNWPPYRDSKS